MFTLLVIDTDLEFRFMRVPFLCSSYSDASLQASILKVIGAGHRG